MSKENGKCEDITTIYAFGIRLKWNLDKVEDDLMYFIDILNNEVVCLEEAREAFRIVCLEMERIFNRLRLLKKASSKYLTNDEINNILKNYSVYF